MVFSSDLLGESPEDKIKSPDRLKCPTNRLTQIDRPWRLPSFTFPSDTNCCSIGSAQQYHGSSRNGTGVRCQCWRCAALRDSQQPFARRAGCAKKFPCGTSSGSPRAAQDPKSSRHRASTRASSCFHGKISAAESNGPTISRTSGNSSSRDPAGISKRMAS